MVWEVKHLIYMGLLMLSGSVVRKPLSNSVVPRQGEPDSISGPVYEIPPMGEDGLPGEPLHLIAARDVLDPDEIEFFVSNAPAEAPVGVLLFTTVTFNW